MTIEICGPQRLGKHDIPGGKAAPQNPGESQEMDGAREAARSLEAQRAIRPGPTQPVIDSPPLQDVHPSLDSTNAYRVSVNMGIRLLPSLEVEFTVYWKTEAVKKKQNKPKNLGVVAHTSDPSREGGSRRNGSSKSAM